MKIFMATEFASSKVTIRIINDAGEAWSIVGEYCNDYQPALGCEFPEGTQDKIMEWISKSKEKYNCAHDWFLGQFMLGQCVKCGKLKDE